MGYYPQGSMGYSPHRESMGYYPPQMPPTYQVYNNFRRFLIYAFAEEVVTQ
jgi:hypothetical protein